MAKNLENNSKKSSMDVESKGHVDMSEEEAEAQMLAALEAANSDSSVNASIADFPKFNESKKRGFFEDDKLEFLKDLQLNVYIELGRTKMEIKDILELERGYVIELEKLASEPVDVYVNNKKIAEGEVVVIDKHFGIRVTSLLEANERLQGVK